MIFDSIQNKENYRDFPMLYKALCYLSTLPDGELPPPGTVFVDNVLFCNPVHLMTRPESECMYEAHRKFIDLHYTVSGVERIATADTESLEYTTAYDENKDIGFLNGPADGYYDVKPGQFMVCFPNDAHKVAMMTDAPAPVSKVVFKIAVNK